MGMVTQFLVEQMTLVIVICAIVESVMFYMVNVMCRRQGIKLQDAFTNSAKGLDDVPDSRTSQSVHDRILSMSTYLERKVNDSGDDADRIKRNINAQMEKNDSYDTFSIESLFNIGSALVQIFPLLGIFGTILALSMVDHQGAQEAFATSVISAFVVAIDTTLYGMLFAIIFMVVEARTLTRVSRILEDTRRANNFFAVIR